MRTSRRVFVTVLVTLVILLATGPVQAGAPPRVPPGLERAIAAQEAHTDALLANPGVVGTAVGVGADGQPVVKVYTESTRVTGIPDRLDGVPVEVDVTGRLVAQGHALTRPSPIGVSTGSERLIIYSFTYGVRRGLALLSA